MYCACYVANLLLGRHNMDVYLPSVGIPWQTGPTDTDKVQLDESAGFIGVILKEYGWRDGDESMTAAEPKPPSMGNSSQNMDKRS